MATAKKSSGSKAKKTTKKAAAKSSARSNQGGNKSATARTGGAKKSTAAKSSGTSKTGASKSAGTAKKASSKGGTAKSSTAAKRGGSKTSTAKKSGAAGKRTASGGAKQSGRSATAKKATAKSTSKSSGSRSTATKKTTTTARAKSAAPAKKTAAKAATKKAAKKATAKAATKRQSKSTAKRGNGKGIVERVTDTVTSLFSNAKPNAIDLLKADHDKVDGYFQQVKANEDGDNFDVFKNIKFELDAHAHIEETIFYPYLIEKGDEELQKIVREGIEEHRQAKMFLAELNALDGDDDRFKAKLKVLMEDIEHHVQEEEGEMFKMAEDQIEAEKLESMGEQMEREKTAFQDRMPAPPKLSGRAASATR